MLNIQTVLLDIDGTLLDFAANQEYALNTAFSNHGITLTEEIVARYNTINHGLWKDYELGRIERDTVLNTRFVRLFEELEIAVDGIAFEQDYQTLLGEGAFLIDGALELVQYLHTKYELYIVTNGVAMTQTKRLKKSGLDQYMKKVFISESLGCQKPQLEFFNKVFAEIEAIDPSKTIIVGDTLSSDILGGNNANLITCWFNPNGHQNDTEAKVDLEIKQLSELRNYL